MLLIFVPYRVGSDMVYDLWSCPIEEESQFAYI